MSDLQTAVLNRLDAMQRQIDAISIDHRTPPPAPVIKRDETAAAELQHLRDRVRELEAALNGKADFRSVKAGDTAVITAIVDKLHDMDVAAKTRTESVMQKTVGAIHADLTAANRATRAAAESASEFLIAKADAIAR